MEQQLYQCMRQVLGRPSAALLQRFSPGFLQEILTSVDEESAGMNIQTTDTGFVFIGYPSCQHLMQVAKVLTMWQSQGRFPVEFAVMQDFGTETTTAEVDRCNSLTQLVAQTTASVTIAQTEEMLMSLGPRGLLSCLGVRLTKGSSQEHSLPSKRALVNAFNQLNLENEGEESKRVHSSLTVGARALTKHSHRSSEGFWGNVRGSEARKNELASELLERILRDSVWINIHSLPNEEVVLELRVQQGYGARWFILHDQGFRGFLEPQMQDGHEKHWRH